MDKKRIGNCILLVPVCLLLAFVLSSGMIKKDYAREEKLDLAEVFTEASDVSYDPLSGDHLVTGEDPSLTFREINDSFDACLVRLKAPAEYVIPITVYWTRNPDEPFVGALYRSGNIQKGEDEIVLMLPDYPIASLRIDIDGDTVLDRLSMLSLTGYTLKYEGRFFLSLALRFLLLFGVGVLSLRSFPGIGKALWGTAYKREDYRVEYDLLRIIATFFVIALHLLNDTFMPAVVRGDPGYAFFKFTEALTISCNAIYVLLSGALILRPGPDPEKEEGILAFYRRKLPAVVCPMLCYFAYYMIQGFPEEIFREGISDGLWKILGYLTAGRSPYTPHFWLIYVIIGLYLAAPFLKILIKALGDGRVGALVLALFIAGLLGTYLPMIHLYFGLEISLSSWGGLFLLGYYLTTEHARKFYPLFPFLGIAGLTISFLTHYFRPDLLESVSTSAPAMWLMGAGLFVSVRLMTERFHFRKSAFIASLSGYSYGMLLIHLYFLKKYVLPIGWRYETEHGQLKLTMLLMIIITYVISYFFAVLYDNTAVRLLNRSRRSGTS